MIVMVTKETKNRPMLIINISLQGQRRAKQGKIRYTLCHF